MATITRPRQGVFLGHYVPVTPTPISAPEIVASTARPLFHELGLSDALAQERPVHPTVFPATIQPWRRGRIATVWLATGYALSIYGHGVQPAVPRFGTGNGYGDGRAISVFEGVFEGQALGDATQRRWPQAPYAGR